MAPVSRADSRRQLQAIAEQLEPELALRQMTEVHHVVLDYSHIGLTLRAYPLTFLGEDLQNKSVITYVGAMATRNGRQVSTASLVHVRQKSGSAKAIMFITIEDETDLVDVVFVWPTLFKSGGPSSSGNR